MAGLGTIYYQQGKIREAEHFFKRSIVVVEDKFGPDHPEVARRLTNLALVYSAQDRFKDAERLYIRCLKIYENAYNSDHRQVGIVLVNVANVYQSQGRFNDAERALKRSIRIFEKSFGINHPNVGRPLAAMASNYYLQKRYSEAERFFKKSLAAKSALGKDHIQTGWGLSNLALVYVKQGRHREAEPIALRSRAILEREFGAGDPRVNPLLVTLSEIYTKLGRRSKAAALNKKFRDAPGEGARNVDLYFATNRKPEGASLHLGTGRTKSPRFGRVTIRVPAKAVERRAKRLTEASGLVGQASTGTLTTSKDLKLIKKEFFPNAKKFASAGLKKLRRAANFSGQVLIFVHGYNTNYNEAMQRATQLVFNLEFDGLLIPFAWPSQGRPTLIGYLQDRTAAKQSVDALVELIDTLHDQMPEKVSIHFLAHSMGNQLLLRALEKISKRGPRRFLQVRRSYRSTS